MRTTPPFVRETPRRVADFLEGVRLRTTFVVLGRLGPGARVDLPAEGMPALHTVRGGACEVQVDGVTHHLADGDVWFMPSGRARQVRVPSAQGVPARAHGIPTPQPGRQVHFACGDEPRVDVLGVAACLATGGPALALLPDVVSFPGSAPLRQQLLALQVQASADAPGSGVLATRLAEVVFLHTLRDVLTRRPEASALAAAARDDQLARALLAVQRDLAHRWTVPELAALAGMSRSAFASTFRRVVGRAPIEFLRSWRMAEAAHRLRGGRQVQLVADDLGYRSAAAFSVAFKRERGVAPSTLRGLDHT